MKKLIAIYFLISWSSIGICQLGLFDNTTYMLNDGECYANYFEVSKTILNAKHYTILVPNTEKNYNNFNRRNDTLLMNYDDFTKIDWIQINHEHPINRFDDVLVKSDIKTILRMVPSETWERHLEAGVTQLRLTKKPYQQIIIDEKYYSDNARKLSIELRPGDLIGYRYHKRIICTDQVSKKEAKLMCSKLLELGYLSEDGKFNIENMIQGMKEYQLDLGEDTRNIYKEHWDSLLN